MASIIHLVCKDCREWLWLGQSPAWDRSLLWVYSTMADNEKQGAFYKKHLDHALVAVDDSGFDRLDVGDEPMQEFMSEHGSTL